jgi:hypothetical protein
MYDISKEFRIKEYIHAPPFTSSWHSA